MASTDDLLTVYKSYVSAVAAFNTTIPKYFGQLTLLTVTSPTVIATGMGRVVNVSVTVAGSAAGAIYNWSSATGYTSMYQLFVVPNALGITNVGLFFTNGILLVPGTGQSLNITYSMGV